MIGARQIDGLRALVALAFALLVLACSLPVAAQAGRVDDSNIAARLFAEGPPAAGQDWMVAIRFTPRSEEWHGYWANPGDAGLGMTLDWNLPEGWEAGEPLYPVPRRLTVSGLMNHVYKGEYAVLVPIRVPENAAPESAPPIGLVADYLACTDRICVPQRAQMTLDPANISSDAAFAGWRAAIAPLLDSVARFDAGGDRLNLAIPLPANLELGAPHVFIENLDLVDYGAPQAFARQGDLLIAQIPLEDGGTAEEVRGIVRFGDGEGVRFVAQAGEVPLGGTALKGSVDSLPSVWLALLGALAGGLLLNVMPCVFPILSLKALSLAKAGGDENAARRDALAYTAGVVAACLALGGLLLALRAAGENIGWAFQLQEPIVVVALLVLAMAITANFAGGFALPGLVLRGGTGGRSSFATGLLAAFVATPCTGPFMAAAMGAALLLPQWQAMALFGALGIGLALPFLLLGYVPALRRVLPRPGPWMETFRRLMAVPMALTTAALIWLLWRMGGLGFALAATTLAIAITLLLAGVLGGLKGSSARWLAAGIATFTLIGMAMGVEYSFTPRDPQAAQSIHDPVPFTKEALAGARQEGRPVFVWFTADWCLTCKVNERIAIEQPEVQAAFARAGVVTMRADWTRRDEAITQFLTQQGAAGVPLYLWYGPGSDAQQLPQVLTPGLLVQRASDLPSANGSAQ